jgi:hypothetical protein
MLTIPKRAAAASLRGKLIPMCFFFITAVGRQGSCSTGFCLKVEGGKVHADKEWEGGQAGL